MVKDEDEIGNIVFPDLWQMTPDLHFDVDTNIEVGTWSTAIDKVLQNRNG